MGKKNKNRREQDDEVVSHEERAATDAVDVP
jgi:hypothetical protein